MNEFNVIQDNEIRDCYKASLIRPNSGSRKSGLKLEVVEDEAIRAGNILQFLRDEATDRNNYQLAFEIGLTIKALSVQLVKQGIMPCFSPVRGKEQVKERLPSQFRGIVRAIENRVFTKRGVL